MTTQALATAHAPTAADEARSQRVLALSGVLFVPFFLVGWFVSGGVTPHYNAPAQDWVNWAHDNQWKGRISAFAMLLAAFIFLYFMSFIRGVLAESRTQTRRGRAQGRESCPVSATRQRFESDRGRTNAVLSVFS